MSYSISSLIKGDGKQMGGATIQLEHDEVHSRGVFSNFKWDGEEVEEATGNEGGSVEKW